MSRSITFLTCKRSQVLQVQASIATIITASTCRQRFKINTCRIKSRTHNPTRASQGTLINLYKNQPNLKSSSTIRKTKINFQNMTATCQMPKLIWLDHRGIEMVIFFRAPCKQDKGHICHHLIVAEDNISKNKSELTVQHLEIQ